LEAALLALQEQELELNDEGAGIKELLSLQAHRKGMPGATGSGASSSATTAPGEKKGGSSRRRRGEWARGERAASAAGEV
jgi:hypothetical protein